MDSRKKYQEIVLNHGPVTDSASLEITTFNSQTMLVRVSKQNLVVSSRCCCAEDGKKELQEKLCRTSTVIVLLIKPFVWRHSPCRRRRGLRKLLIAFGMLIRKCF